MNLRQLFQHLVRDAKAGSTLVLEAWNYGRENKMSEQMFNNKLNPFNESHNTNLTEFERGLDAIEGWHGLATYSAAKCNSIVVRLPDVPDMGDMALLDSFMQIMQELGKLSGEFQAAYADGKIDDKEFKRISLEVDASVSKLLSFKASVEQVTQ